MLKIAYAVCLGLSPAISAQFTLEMRVAARNRKKIHYNPLYDLRCCEYAKVINVVSA